MLFLRVVSTESLDYMVESSLSGYQFDIRRRIDFFKSRFTMTV